MKFSWVLCSALLCTASLSDSAYSADVTNKAESFQPFELVGAWQFKSNSSGTQYGGDVRLLVTTSDSNGVMRGKISYDGRQTNDACSTRGVFKDDPVDVEVIKAEKEYRISFNVKCARGESPRLRSWTLTCENMVCTRPEVLPNGQGLLTLTEKR